MKTAKKPLTAVFATLALACFLLCGASLTPVFAEPVSAEGGFYMQNGAAIRLKNRISVLSQNCANEFAKPVRIRLFGFGLDANMNTLKTMRLCATLTHWLMVRTLKNSR